MIEFIIILSLLLIIAGSSFYSRRKLRSKRQLKASRGIQQLSAILDLIQRLQRHRGICGNLSENNQNERQQLSYEIDGLWSPLLKDSYWGNKKRVQIQHVNWQKIQLSPIDSFISHCDLIEKLLHELTVVADVCSLTATNNSFNNQELRQNLLRRPHYAESLARLRGLGNQAASMGYCPAAIRVQLQYLLLQMNENPIGDLNQNEIEELVRVEILETEQINIEPRVYFSRLTQAIDEQIQQTLVHLQQLHQ